MTALLSRRALLGAAASLLAAPVLPLAAAPAPAVHGPMLHGPLAPYQIRAEQPLYGFGLQALVQLFDGDLAATDPRWIAHLSVSQRELASWHRALRTDEEFEPEERDLLDWLQQQEAFSQLADPPPLQGWYTLA